MKDSPQSGQPVWIPAALVAVLAAQVGLLWLHGGLLNRQHGQIQAMRQDIQDLTEALDGNLTGQGSGTQDGNFQPAGAKVPIQGPRHQQHLFRRTQMQRTSNSGNVKFVLQDKQDSAPADDQEQGRKEMQDARDSAKKAADRSYKAQQQLSISENIRKAEEKKKIEAATSNFLPIVYGAMALGLVAFILGRMWRARSDGR